MRVNPIRTNIKRLTLKDIRKRNHPKTANLSNFKTPVVTEEQMQAHRAKIENQSEKMGAVFNPQPKFDKYWEKITSYGENVATFMRDFWSMLG